MRMQVMAEFNTVGLTNRTEAVFVSPDGKYSYRVVLDVDLKPLGTDGYEFVREAIVPIGLTLPDGDYTRAPHEYDANSRKVHVVGGALMAGWI